MRVRDAGSVIVGLALNETTGVWLALGSTPADGERVGDPVMDGVPDGVRDASNVPRGESVTVGVRVGVDVPLVTHVAVNVAFVTVTFGRPRAPDVAFTAGTAQ